MPAPVTALTPLFRSENQMRVLAEVFFSPRPLTGAELARRTGIPQQTVAREIARLASAGLVTTEQVGTAKLVSPSDALPYRDALRELLAYASGVIPLLHAAYEPIAEVSEVFIFGSWADRFHGEPGPPPNDVDVAVVSRTLSRFDLAETRLRLEQESGLRLDQFVFEPDNERLTELRAGSVPVMRRSP